MRAVSILRLVLHLEALRRHSPERPVTAAVLQLPGGAGPGHGVRHPGAGDGVDEARLPRAGRHHGVGAQGSLPVCLHKLAVSARRQKIFKSRPGPDSQFMSLAT